MRRRYFIFVSIILICITFAPHTSIYAQSNNYYWQQQQMRQQQMMQQQRQQEQMRRQQEQARRQQEQMRRQQEQMRRQQQQMRRQMQQRQQQALKQRQQMAERQRQMQRRQHQQQQRRLQEQQRTQNQRKQLARQQQALQQRQALQQQRLMKQRQDRLHRLQQERFRKQQANKKKDESRVITMAALTRQQTKLNLASTQPKQTNLNQSVKQFQQKRQQQQKQQRLTKQLETQRKNTQARIQKARLAQKQSQNKKLIEKKRQQQKQTQTQKLAQANFGSCKGNNCKTCSFHGDTLVLTMDGFEPIASLTAGEDYVWARNEYTGDADWKPVTAHYSNPYEETVTISVQNTDNGKAQKIISNRIHPFFVSNSEALLTDSANLIYGTNETGRWIQAQDLQSGNMLVTDSGSPAEVINLEIKDEPLKAYNITVNEYHTYFVKGAVNDNTPAVWVHNDCDPKKTVITGGGRYLNNSWYKGTFPNKLESVKYHLAKHGKGRTPTEYTRDAMNFFRKNKLLGEPVTLKDGTPGIKIQTKTKSGGKTGGYWTQDGRLVTFWD